jgi:hypothetical protein
MSIGPSIVKSRKHPPARTCSALQLQLYWPWALLLVVPAIFAGRAQAECLPLALQQPVDGIVVLPARGAYPCYAFGEGELLVGTLYSVGVRLPQLH